MFKFMPKHRPHSRGQDHAGQPAGPRNFERPTARAAQGGNAAADVAADAAVDAAVDAAADAAVDAAADGAADGAPAARIIIADRAEFIDALFRLRRGHVLVRPRAAREDERVSCMLDSGIVYTAFEPLIRYGLIGEYRNAEGFSTMRYYRLTTSGLSFADQACKAWRQRPLLDRMAVRLFG